MGDQPSTASERLSAICALVASAQLDAPPAPIDSECARAAALLSQADAKELKRELTRHGLAPALRHALRHHALTGTFAPELEAWLQAEELYALHASEQQQRALTELGICLDAEEIPWVLLKGLHLAQELYRAPHLRPGCDLDVLVDESRLAETLKALEALGYQTRPETHSTHEVTLVGRRATVDLHFRYARPDRTRGEFAPVLLASRKRTDGYWTAGDDETLFLLLTHPALTDYVTARANRAIDLLLWLKKKGDGTVPERSRVLLKEFGMQTAAWTTLRWLSNIAPGQSLPGVFGPGPLKRAYLAAWLRADPQLVYNKHQTFARMGFSLALQDSWADVFRAIVRRVKVGRTPT